MVYVAQNNSCISLNDSNNTDFSEKKNPQKSKQIRMFKSSITLNMHVVAI